MFTIECYSSGELTKSECAPISIVEPPIHETFHRLSTYFSTISSQGLAIQEMHTESLNILLQGIREATHSAYVAILISKPYEQSGCILESVASFSKKKKYTTPSLDNHPDKLRMVVPDDTNPNLFVRAFSTNSTIISNDVSNDPRLGCVMPKNHIPIRTMLATPITSETNVPIGQLVCINAKSYHAKNIIRISPLLKLVTHTLKSLEDDAIDSNPFREVQDMKHNFLATMSHEIRTPLSGVVGMISLLQGTGNLNEQQRHYVARALNCCCQLMEIINDILDYSKMQSHTLALIDEPFNIRECIDNSINIIATRAQSKNITITIDVDDTVPQVVYGDGKRIQQIFINLLGNAVKFTNDGSICARVLVERVVDTIYTMRFEVKDTGIGIDPRNQKSIFNVFEQVDNHLFVHDDEPSRSGTGLGLAICRELAHLMQSEVYVQSDGVGKGSTFYFTIDMQSEITESQIQRFSNTEVINVLVVDDNTDNRMILSGFMYKWKMTATVCASANEALHEFRLGKKFHVAIVDVCMPHISGLELAQTLRKEFPDIPLIALSSKELESKGRVWFDEFFIKPFNHMKLYKTILEVCSKPCESNPHSIKKDIDDLRVCVCEDDSNNQFVLKEMLKQLGVSDKHITVVQNGRLAVQECMHTHFDVCLMDLRMPIMDGFEASQQIKRLVDSPSIIVVSASILESDKKRISDIGVDGYITKPFDKSDLRNVICRYVSKLL